jgi:hypothetical protein
MPPSVRLIDPVARAREFAARGSHEVLHDFTQVGERCADQKMEVIAHEHEGVDPASVTMMNEIEMAAHDFPYELHRQIEPFFVDASGADTVRKIGL